MTAQAIQDQLKIIPDNPGIYKFFDQAGNILYIGKAKDLKKRVRSYFTKSKQSGKITVLVSKIYQIDYVLTDSEFDAFLLENTLIKKHQPRYNVNLKDGKTYPYICIKKERFPRVFPTRNFTRDGSEYFGPFASVTLMNTVLDVIKKLFTLRSCNLNLSDENISSGKFKVCLDYHINLCKGPCEALQSEANYLEDIQHIRKILNGNTSLVIKTLKKQMQAAATNLEFEKAEDLKQKTELLERFHARSTVVNPRINNVDVFSVWSNNNKAFVNYLRVVNGAIVQSYSLEYKKKLDESDPEILKLAIVELKERFNSRATEIIVPAKLSIKDKAGNSPFRFVKPVRGDKKKLLDLSYKNALQYAGDQINKHSSKDDNSEARLEMIQKDLNLKFLPDYIECIDNSHLQGKQPVSSVVVFRNAKPSVQDYRLFNLQTVIKPDDYAGMEEVVLRRYGRLLAEKHPLPSLLIIDGGKGQLNAALKSLKKLGLDEKIAIRSIAKRLEEIYQPGDPYPLHINKKSDTLRVIQHLRDESHRFAIKHHRNRRVKAGINSRLSEINGVGDATIRKLLEMFRSVNGIRNANPEDVEKLIGKDKANKVFSFFQQKDHQA